MVQCTLAPRVSRRTATGDTGRAAVKESIALGLDVRAMVHNKDARSEALEKLGAEVVVGDLLEINTVRAAMEGVDAAYLVWPVQPGLIHATVNFAQAAKEAGVSTIINLSQRSANRESTSNSCRDSFIAEEVLNWSGLPVIHLRPTYFLEWLLYPWQLPYLQQGILRMPVGKGRHSPIAADDQGRAIAALLKSPEEHIGKTILLSGPVEMDHEQMAAELSEALGRKIVFQDLPIDEYCTSIEKMGVPAYIVQHLSGAMADYQNGRMSGADNNVEKLTGRRSMTVGEFARAHADVLNGK
jgi:NAD(P)H dehydrogenase (quinone)